MPRQMTLTQIRRELAQKGIRSEKAMYEKLPKASKRIRLGGIKIIADRPSTSAVPLLAQFLHDEDEDIRMEAACALAAIGGKASLHMVAGILEMEHRSAVRQAAAYALAFMFEDESLDLLTSLLRNPDESPPARGLAAEGIANVLEHADPRARRHKGGVKLLIQALGDRSPHVRFWASFALGRLGSREAVPHLQRLVDTDSANCPGWWPVAREAEDAILSIMGKEHPDHARRTGTS